MSIRVYEISGLNGRILQGGAEAVRNYYVDETLAADVVIVNCARRIGDVKIESGELGPIIYWLPMNELDRVAVCKRYLGEYGAELIQYLKEGKTVVVNCQEGLHRSVEFAKQLVKLARLTKELQRMENI